MKKILVLFMIVGLAGGVAFAHGKYIDDTGEPDGIEEAGRTYDHPCGEPVEDPFNNSYCNDPDPTELYCGSTIYAWASVVSHDYFIVHIPPYTEVTVSIFQGPNCDQTPTPGVKMILKSRAPDCDALTDWSRSTLVWSNGGICERTILVKTVRCEQDGSRCEDLPDVTYRLDVTCTDLPNECDPEGVRNYCEDPILVPAGDYVNGIYRYEHTENACCATDEVEYVKEEGCNDFSAYRSGPDVIYLIQLERAATLDVTVGEVGGPDVQLMIFTDCADPEGTCLYSSDKAWNHNHGYNVPEILTGIALGPGTFYLSTSVWQECACDHIRVIIESDEPLPVELNGFSATPGDGEVTLSWSTASETDADRFDILRDGLRVGRRTAENLATGAAYTYTDVGLTNGRAYSYSLVLVGLDGSEQVLATETATPNRTAAAISEFALHQNYPNPFNPETNITFDLAEQSFVTMTVFNSLGQQVASLANGTLPEGRHTVAFDGRSLPSGLYLCRLEAGDFAAQMKMLLIK